MQRLNQDNINTPALFDEKFHYGLGVTDIPRFEKLCKYFKGGVYVDVGCWDSPMPLILSERYPKSEIHALDFAVKTIEFLKPRLPKVKYQLIETCYSLPFEDESVDYVVAGEIIEHLEDPAAFIKECFRILKKGGYLAVSTPHIEAEKDSKVGGPTHLWSYDREDLDTLFNNPEVETLQEDNYLTWLIWKEK